MPPAGQRLRVRFPPLSQSIDLQGSPTEVTELLSKRWLGDVAPAPGTPPAFLLRWRVRAPGDHDHPPIRAARPTPSPVRWRPAAVGGALGNRGGRILWKTGHREATVELRAGCAQHPTMLEPLVEAALGMALASQGCCFLHAAAVEIGARRLLVVGASGSGKSTLAAAAAACGGRVISDDSLLLSTQRGRPLVRAARRDLWLRPGATSLFTALRRRGLPPERTQDTRLRLRRATHPPAFRTYFEPDRLVLLRRDLRLTRFHLEQRSQADALAALARGTSALYLFGQDLAPGVPSLLGLVSDFAERLPTAELRLGRWLVEEPERCLEALVAEL